ncbi:hypothetical protein J6590_020732 [Homalodisca vitripennis]|nr:hypothetical protein J6590_020732 [Homalodisca vitripennis]
MTDRRVGFCDIMMSKLDTEPELLNRILFSDEATFLTNVTVNRHNCRYWSDLNPHWYIEAHTNIHCTCTSTYYVRTGDRHLVASRWCTSTLWPEFATIFGQYFPKKVVDKSRGAVELPVRSPDLDPLDYFFWDLMKNLGYKTILEKLQLISRQLISNAVSALYTRLAHFQTAEGQQLLH